MVNFVISWGSSWMVTKHQPASLSWLWIWILTLNTMWCVQTPEAPCQVVISATGSSIVSIIAAKLGDNQLHTIQFRLYRQLWCRTTHTTSNNKQEQKVFRCFMSHATSLWWMKILVTVRLPFALILTLIWLMSLDCDDLYSNDDPILWHHDHATTWW